MSADGQASAERINLVYKSSAPGGATDVELPFRLLVLGNFTADDRADYFDNQQPVNVNLTNFSKVLGSFSPSITLKLPDFLSDEDDAESLVFNFKFQSLEDFNPALFIRQCPTLTALVDLRAKLLEIRQSDEGDSLLKNRIDRLNDDATVSTFLASISHGDPLDASLIDFAITELDERLSNQVDAIIHHATFRQLESVWRSLYFLIERTRFDENCLVEILNVSKTALLEDFEDAPELIKSQLYNRVYSNEFGQFGGKPYSCMLGDYAFGPKAQDVWLLQQLSGISAMAHAPLIAAPSPELFDVDSFADIARLRDLSANFDQPKFVKWNAFRQSEDARYIGLALPGFLLRKQYNEDNPIGVFRYKERSSKKDKGLWGNAAFAFATRLLESFANTRWCIDVSGAEHGRVAGLSMIGDPKAQTRGKTIPTEVLISDRREAEFLKWGFIPLTVHKGEDTAAFYGASSVQDVREYGATEAGEAAALNFQLGAQLPYLLIVSRLSHYIKMMQREHIGSWTKGAEIEQEINKWIRQYVTDMDNPAPNVRIRRPLRKAEVTVRDVAGKNDWYVIQLTVTPHMKYMGEQFTLNQNGRLEKY